MRFLNITCLENIKFEEIGKGSKIKNLVEVTIKDATNYACEDVDITIHLYEVLSAKVFEYDATNFLEGD